MLSAFDLRCEYRTNPLGVQTLNPRLSWHVESNSPDRGQKQSAYRILVASSEFAINADRGDLWDSGKVSSSQIFHIPYNGKQLSPGQKVFWSVRIWDAADLSTQSKPASWTAGLQLGDWKAEWITAEPETGHTRMPLFRREIKVDSAIRRAVIFVCGLGHYELHVNGKTAGEDFINPGWTNYKKTCLYVTHDVTDLVNRGENAIGVMLGNGMYNVAGGRYRKFKASYGPPKLILQMLIETDAGQTWIVSDENWKTSPGPITFSCIFGGEDYDARLEQPGWDSSGFSDANWKPALRSESPGGVLKSQSNPPIRVHDTFTTKTITEPQPGVFVHDLGQNFSGRPSIAVRGPAGAKITLTSSELLDEAGMAFQKPIGGPVNFSYTLAGNGIETWQPRFSYHGFRYLQINTTLPEGSTEKLEKIEISGQFTYASAEPAGRFACSSELFNRIHRLIDFAIASNMQSVLTDCPHREKLGWLEESHLMAEGVMANHHVALLYAKISDDIRDSQHDDGCVPTIAPEYMTFKDKWADFSNSPEWGSAAIINPWFIYQRYGDTQILKDNYASMKAYLAYLQSREENGLINFGLADWYDIGPGDPGFSKLTSKELTGTCIYFHDAHIMQKTAELLGFREDAEAFSQLSERIRTAFNDRLYDAEAGHYDRGSQTSSAMPLALCMIPPKRYSQILKKLIDDIRANNNHITAGDIGFRFVVQSLADAHRSDVMVDLLERTDPPSYGSQLERGATTLTEAWDANRINSQNHLMLGHAEIWFYERLAGIRIDLSHSGLRQIIIRPAPVGDITWAEADSHTMFGTVSVRWERQGDQLTLRVTVPTNAVATVYVPTRDVGNVRESDRAIADAPGVRLVNSSDSSAVFEVAGGSYEFTSLI